MNNPNKPVSREEMEAFKANPKQRSIGGKTFMYRDNDGTEHYFPNRSEGKRHQKQMAAKAKIVNNRKTTRGRLTITLNEFIEKFGKKVKVVKSQFKMRKD